jgi:hypothetical protein
LQTIFSLSYRNLNWVLRESDQIIVRDGKGRVLVDSIVNGSDVYKLREPPRIHVDTFKGFFVRETWFKQAREQIDSVRNRLLIYSLNREHIRDIKILRESGAIFVISEISEAIVFGMREFGDFRPIQVGEKFMISIGSGIYDSILGEVID